MSESMKSFDMLLSAIGLSMDKTTASVTQGKYILVYRYQPGDGASQPLLTITLNPQVTATIRRDSWDNAVPVSGTERGPNFTMLSHQNKLLSMGGRVYTIKSRWYADIKECESDMFIHFYHDSDSLTSKVVKTMDVVVASLQSYL
ncbi:hypothetical protein [Desulfovibrio ferrophilus]|uniref:6,7-dimethyl-8-ribityllumazine synthase n=1 Tax=Desulfovibrio ferrophilus TaxID=241368 RepID=A0A2Z6B3L7_9BACT|nr:hypothetical protein [Desulfovibrio ferrophilus]BBD10081.1 6,7-dimethyl-8-ribityllumazine synthase [Desulfovibrio ferrophilus]